MFIQSIATGGLLLLLLLPFSSFLVRFFFSFSFLFCAQQRQTKRWGSGGYIWIFFPPLPHSLASSSSPLPNGQLSDLCNILSDFSLIAVFFLFSSLFRPFVRSFSSPFETSKFKFSRCRRRRRLFGGRCCFCVSTTAQVIATVDRETIERLLSCSESFLAAVSTERDTILIVSSR